MEYKVSDKRNHNDGGGLLVQKRLDMAGDTKIPPLTV